MRSIKVFVVDRWLLFGCGSGLAVHFSYDNMRFRANVYFNPLIGRQWTDLAAVRQPFRSFRPCNCHFYNVIKCGGHPLRNIDRNHENKCYKASLIYQIIKTRWLQTDIIIFESFLTSFELRAIFEAGRGNRLKSNHYNNQI